MGFARFQLSSSLLQSIAELGYAEPTPIQAQAIPEVLRGRDVRACAQTGTGKTCAFVVPIIEKLLQQPSHQRPSVLVLTPTRELAAQIITVTHGLLKGTRIRTALILGGVNFGQQAKELRAPVDIVVATPGRLLDHVQQKTISLRNITTLVLDEADRMLDMGFLPDIKRILAEVAPNRQTMLFSATYDNQIKQLTNQFLKNPVVIEVSSSTSATSENVTQIAYSVPAGQKRALLQGLLELGNMTSALVFTRTKHGANKLHLALQSIGKTSAVIHSNRSQNQRQFALQGFKEGRFQILVATDIAARGIDVKNISHVINYDVPRHPEDYVHRIGRTGRAQAVGEAFTLVAPDEEPYLKKIESFIKKTISRGVLPDFPYQSKPVVLAQVPPKSVSTGTPETSSRPLPQRTHGFSDRKPRPSHDRGRDRFPKRDRSSHSSRQRPSSDPHPRRDSSPTHGRGSSFSSPSASSRHERGGRGFQFRPNRTEGGSSSKPGFQHDGRRERSHNRPGRDDRFSSDRAASHQGEGSGQSHPRPHRGDGASAPHSAPRDGRSFGAPQRRDKGKFRWRRRG